MAWNLAKLQLEPTVGAIERIGECADTEGRLVKLGGDVLKFRWLVLLGSRIPTLGLLSIVWLERVVRVAKRSLPGLVLKALLEFLLVMVGSFMIFGGATEARAKAVVCCGGAGEKSESGEFLHIRIFF